MLKAKLITINCFKNETQYSVKHKHHNYLLPNWCLLNFPNDFAFANRNEVIFTALAAPLHFHDSCHGEKFTPRFTSHSLLPNLEQGIYLLTRLQIMLALSLRHEISVSFELYYVIWIIQCEWQTGEITLLKTFSNFAINCQ